jgi:nucleotide-binding universal stress UspA family protein
VTALLGYATHAARAARLRRLLVATDGSEAALAPLRMAAALVAVPDGEPTETGVAVVAVTDPHAAEPVTARMDRRLALVQAQLGAVGGAAPTWALVPAVGDPVAQICRCAADHHADLLLLGLGRRAVDDRILGSEVALHVAERAPMPVLAVPHTAAARPQVAVCGVDTRPSATATAARMATVLLAPDGALHLVHVTPFDATEPDVARGRQHLAEVAVDVRAVTPVQVDTTVMRGTPADALLAFARARHADVVAVVRHDDDAPPAGHGALLAAIVRGAECAVLVVPAPRPPRDAH